MNCIIATAMFSNPFATPPVQVGLYFNYMVYTCNNKNIKDKPVNSRLLHFICLFCNIILKMPLSAKYVHILIADLER